MGDISFGATLIKYIIQLKQISNKTLLSFIFLFEGSRLQKQKTNGIFNTGFMNLTHHPGSMDVIAIPSEFPRCLSELFNENLLFIWFILENNWSQMFVMPRRDYMNKAWLWSEGYLYLIGEVLQQDERNMIQFFFELNIWLQFYTFRLKIGWGYLNTVICPTTNL